MHFLSIVFVLTLIGSLYMLAYYLRYRATTVPNTQMMLRKAHEDSYVRVRLDDVSKVDMLDAHEAVIHLADGQKMTVEAKDARRVLRKLRT